MKEAAHPAMYSLYCGVPGLRGGVASLASDILVRTSTGNSVAFIDTWFVFDLKLPWSGLAQNQDAVGGLVDCLSFMIRLPNADRLRWPSWNLIVERTLTGCLLVAAIKP